MGRPRTTSSEIADNFMLAREIGPSRGMRLHDGKKIYRSVQSWQAERVVLVTGEIEWRLFWRGINVVQKLGDMQPAELREWIIEEVEELYSN